MFSVNEKLVASNTSFEVNTIFLEGRENPLPLGKLLVPGKHRMDTFKRFGFWDEFWRGPWASFWNKNWKVNAKQEILEGRTGELLTQHGHNADENDTTQKRIPKQAYNRHARPVLCRLVFLLHLLQLLHHSTGRLEKRQRFRGMRHLMPVQVQIARALGAARQRGQLEHGRHETEPEEELPAPGTAENEIQA